MDSKDISEINRNAWNKIIKEGRVIHPSKGHKENELLDLFISSIEKGGKILDLGCGSGIPIGKKLRNAGFNITGVDVSDEMIKEFKQNIPDSSSFRMPMTEIDWIEEFNGIVSSFSLLCLPPEDFALMPGKIYSALKNNGYFLLFLNKGDSKFGGIWEVQGHELYTTGISEKEIRDKFETIGFKIRRFERETIETNEYGVEKTMIFLMQKDIRK
jgi:SAM-dependent methyltransferase